MDESVAEFIATRGVTRCPPTGCGQLVPRDVVPVFKMTKHPIYPTVTAGRMSNWAWHDLRWQPTRTNIKALRADPEAVYTVQEAAKLLGVSRRTLTIWRNDGAGPKFFMRGARAFYKAADLLAFAENRR